MFDNYHWLTLACLFFNLVGQDIRDRFTGAVEAFSRRNTSAAGRHGEHSRQRTSEDIPSSKDVVLISPFSLKKKKRNNRQSLSIGSDCLFCNLFTCFWSRHLLDI